MKITRYINGNKLSKPLGPEITIKNEIISNTINKINKRLSEGLYLNMDTTEQNVNG